jgi:hypothetical protein
VIELRRSGISLVATLWLLALIVGVRPVVAIAVGLPLMAYAVQQYLIELRRRRR